MSSSASSPYGIIGVPGENQSDPIGAGPAEFSFWNQGPSTLFYTPAMRRSLCPLARRFPSHLRGVVDEVASARRAAEEGVWMPVLRPKMVETFELILIVEEWPSMVIWHPTIRELQHILQRQGFFRNVETWRFMTSHEGGTIQLQVSTALQDSRKIEPRLRTLRDPRRHRLILVLSDCISPAWYTGEVVRLLASWGRNSLVSILQMLPERLWPRSALGRATLVHLRRRRAGVFNTQLDIAYPWEGHDSKSRTGFPVPILTLETRLLTLWAESLAGTSNAWMPGMILPTVPVDQQHVLEHGCSSVLEDLSALPSPLRRVQLFRATASPLAWRLAGYLAATPLTLRLMRFVQQLMVPESHPTHLAEVFLSGLLKRAPRDALSTALDEVPYDFVTGVRELLLGTVLVSDTVTVLTAVATVLNSASKQRLDFRALLTTPPRIDQMAISDVHRPFVAVAIRVLRRLGGTYGELARRLERRLEEGRTSSRRHVSPLHMRPTANTQHRQYQLAPESPPHYPRVRLTYEVQIGGNVEKQELPFVVGVLADLSGKPDEPLPRLRDRKFVDIDRDNFDAVLRGLKPRLAFRVDNKLSKDDSKMAVELRFTSIEDFEPERVVHQVEPLRNLLHIRLELSTLLAKSKRNVLFSEKLNNLELLSNIRQVESLIQICRSDEVGERPRTNEQQSGDPRSRAEQPGHGEASDISQSQTYVSGERITQVSEVLLGSLLEQTITSTRVSSGTDQRQRAASRQQIRTLAEEVKEGLARIPENLEAILEAIIADIDGLLSSQLSPVMQHQEFQMLEASWRGLHYLVSQTDTGPMLQLRVLNISKSELSSDLQSEREVFFQKVCEEEYGTLGRTPFAVLLGDYEFSHHPTDVALLGRLSHIAAAAHAPFIASVSPQFLQMDSFTELERVQDLTDIVNTVEYAAWKAFRNSAHACYVGLTMPHILLRPPYNSEASSAYEFQFKEDINGDVHRCLWGNAVYAFGSRLTDAFGKHGWCAAIQGASAGGLVMGLPTYSLTTGDGAAIKLGPTALSLSEQQAQALSTLGFIPIVHVQHNGTPSAMFLEVPSVQEVKKDAPNVVNAYWATQVNSVIVASRFAHYLTTMVRYKIGVYKTLQEYEDYLNDWISRYVLPEGTTDLEEAAQRPLRAAHITIEEVMIEPPGWYIAVLLLHPYFHFTDAGSQLRVEVQLPPHLMC